MQSISDIIQAIARQRGRTDVSPLALLRPLDGRQGDRISHLPVGGDLEQAWLAMTGEPFHPHQSQALTALRRNEPVALRAESAGVANTLSLLAYALLTAEPAGAGLAITYDAASAQALSDRIDRANTQLPHQLRLSTLLVGEQPYNPYARLVICPADLLHGRLLRHHDRAWELLWSRLQLLLLPEIDRFNGVAGAHLADLLMRLKRTAAAHGAPGSLATVATLCGVAAPEAALTAILGAPWRIVGGDDDRVRETTLAVWRGGATRLRDAADLALALQRNGYFTHIACSPLERAVITPIIGDIPAISIGPEPLATQTLVMVGYPSSAGQLRRALRGDYQAVVLVLGDQPHEQMLARQPELLLNMPAPEWPPAPANAYVTAQHALCAANELPLTSHEVEQWGAIEIVERLVTSAQLVDLPDAEVCWKPGPQAEDPYPEFALMAPSGASVLAQSEQGRQLDMLDPTLFERWSFLGASLPPLAGGMRVMVRGEDQGQVTLRQESAVRRTLPLRRCSVVIRETRQSRRLVGGAALAWGRVVVEEEIYGYREQAAGGQAADLSLATPLKVRWIAPACWFELNSNVQVLGQQIGWCLAAALPLRSLSSMTDLTPCYDHEQRRLYMVDSHPGGNGTAAWLYTHAELLLPVAYDIAYACRNDALLEPLSRIDMDWLLALLGKAAPPPEQPSSAPPAARIAPVAPQPTQPAPPPVRAPEGTPYIELPPRAPRTPPPARPEPPVPPSAADRQGRPAGAGDTGQRPAPPAPQRPAPSARQERFTTDPPPPATGPSRPSQPPREPEPADEGPPDASSLIARLRRQREQREGGQRPAQPQPQPRAPRGPVITRFRVGDRVFCLPYGDGRVTESRVEGDREILQVEFAEYGELEIDTVVSLVRVIEDPERQDDLF